MPKRARCRPARWTRCCALRERSTWSRYGARWSAWTGSHWAPPAAPTTDGDAQAAADASLLSIETYLRPSLRGPGSALTDAVPRLAAGGLVVIRDAFEPEFAERMYRSLDTLHRLASVRRLRGGFSAITITISTTAEEYPADLAWCSKIFGSSSTKAWVTRLSGRSCLGPAAVLRELVPPRRLFPPSQRYRESGPKIPIVRSPSCGIWQRIGGRSGAARCTGARRAYYLPPVFNTLLLFNVGPESNHFVTHVSPYAQGKRLAINGWWTGPAATGGPVWKGPDRISAGSAEIEIY